MRSQNLPGDQAKLGWQRTPHEASLGQRKQLQGVLNLAARIIHMVWMVGEEAGGCHIPKASCKRSLAFSAKKMKPSATMRRAEEGEVPGDRGRYLERGEEKKRREKRKKEEVKNRCRCRWQKK